MNDIEIISIAKLEGFIVVTKDKDFLNNFLLNGAPPNILLLSLGNISNKLLLNILSDNFQQIENAIQFYASLIIMELNRLVVW